MHKAISVLSTEQIIDGIRGGQLIAPLMPSEALIDRYVDQVRAQRMQLRTTDEATARLRALIEPQLMWIKSGIRTALLVETDIYCLPLPLSLAYCQRIEGRPAIVIGQGLIDLIAFRVCCSHFEALLPEALSHQTLTGYRRDLSVLEMLSNALMLLGCHFYALASPLPDVLAPLGESSREDCARAISGAVLFVLLHELGHLQLNHLEPGVVKPLLVQQAVPEPLSADQQQEYEADRFATDALIEMAQVLASFWQGAALNFYQQLESIIGQRSGSHPLAINRRLDADLLKDALGEMHDVPSTIAHVGTLAERFVETEAAVQTLPNALIATPYEACMRIVREVLQLAYDHHGVDLRAAVGSAWRTWPSTGT